MLFAVGKINNFRGSLKLKSTQLLFSILIIRGFNIVTPVVAFFFFINMHWRFIIVAELQQGTHDKPFKSPLLHQCHCYHTAFWVLHLITISDDELLLPENVCLHGGFSANLNRIRLQQLYEPVFAERWCYNFFLYSSINMFTFHHHLCLSVWLKSCWSAAAKPFT